MFEIIRSIFTFFFSRRGLETFWIPCTYWTFPIILMITFSRIENADNITRRIGNAKLVEVEGALVEHDSSKYGGGGLYIYGKTVSLIDNGTLVQLKVVSAPSSLYEFANKEIIILFGRVLDQSLYPTKMTNLNHEECIALSSQEFNDKFIQLQEKAPKEAKQRGYLSIFWLILVLVCMFLKKEMNREK